MAFDYTATRTTASTLIAKFGFSVTFTRPTAGQTFDPVDGSYSGGTPTTIVGNGVLTNFTDDETTNELIERGDKRLLFEAGNGAPEIDDTVVINSVTYRVMDVQTIAPGNVDVIYKVQLRV